MIDLVARTVLKMRSGRRMPWQQDYMQKYYLSRPDFVNGTTEFFDFLTHHVPAGADVLELGAGPGGPTTAFLARSFAAVDGLDIDPACKNNPDLRVAFLYDGSTFPIADASYDAVTSDYVLEHVEHPQRVVPEIARVLRPGGVCVFRAPNARHYVSLVARFTPHWFHVRHANRLRNREADAPDPYPTFYRMNTRRRLQRLFGRAGMDPLELRMIEKQPSYGMSRRALFLAFMCYERVVNASPACAPLRANVLGAFRKPSPNDPRPAD